MVRTEEEPLLYIALAELRGGHNLVEATTLELCPRATTLHLHRSAFWGKVCVWILSMMVTTMFAIDVALTVVLIYCRGNNHYDTLRDTIVVSFGIPRL
uniref:Uncharacterized protein n=1 Tax=Oryza punctata TaxID=4537 RepID=A0A0E0JWH8_ORYPU